MYTALKDMEEHYIGITYSIIVSRMAILVASFHHLESVRNASQKWTSLRRGTEACLALAEAKARRNCPCDVIN